MKAFIDRQKSAEVDVEAYVYRSTVELVADESEEGFGLEILVDPGLHEAARLVSQELWEQPRVAIMVYRHQDQLDPYGRFDFHIIRDEDDDEVKIRDFIETLAEPDEDHFPKSFGDFDVNAGVLVIVKCIPDDIEDEFLLDRLSRHPLKDAISQAAEAAFGDTDD